MDKPFDGVTIKIIVSQRNVFYATVGGHEYACAESDDGDSVCVWPVPHEEDTPAIVWFQFWYEDEDDRSAAYDALAAWLNSPDRSTPGGTEP